MTSPPAQLQIVFVLFDDANAQDVIGPYEVLRWIPGARVSFAAAAAGPVRTEGGLALVAGSSFAAAPRPDVVVVPGGSGELAMREHPGLRAFLGEAHAAGAWIASVCTGALLLGAAGLLRGRRAATHWLAGGELAQFGAIPASERYLIDGKLVSAAGVSAGIDMALALAARLASPEIAQAIQLGIEYAPQPPYQAGSPDRAPAALVARLRAASRFASARAAAAADSG